MTDVLASVKLQRVDDRTTQHIRNSNTLLIPFTELLSDDSENAAANRLMQLCQKDRQSRWICENSVQETNDSYEKELSRGLRLDYVVPRKNYVYKKTNSLSDLMDFESAIVLANTTRRTLESQQQIDTFLLQFGWIRKLNRNLFQLRRMGHFDFQTFRCSFKLGENSEIIRAEVVW